MQAVILAIAGICILASVFLLIRGIGIRRGVPSKGYDVARQEARLTMLVSFSRALLLFILGLILAGIYSLLSRPEVVERVPIPTEVIISPEPTEIRPTMTIAASPPSLSPTTPPPAPTTPPPAPTATTTSTTEPTSTPSLETAVVNSPNGLWLRDEPAGSQEKELLPDGAQLVLLPGKDNIDGQEWQQVRTEAGNEGWVAVDFIVYD